MQIPVEWLKEYVDFEEPIEEIAEKLTMAGLEVGEILDERFDYDNSFVGVIDSCEKHPKREDFYVLTVGGSDKPRIVLTNLRPFEKGEIIPVAYEGYVFPDGSKLEPMKFSGVTSDAKIMSEWDIEYSDDQGVVLPLPENAGVGKCVPDVMGITTKVFSFDMTPNRGDFLCVFGIARELSAILGSPLKKNVFDVEFPEEKLDVDYSVEIKDPDLCPRYTGRLFHDIKICESPLKIKRRLRACGMRPINSIVDITNYVMLETGQPLHAFDLDTLEDRAIIVRRAAKDEKIITIDDIEQELTENMLVIADKSVPVAVAGVMGGMLTEITDKTTNMLLESAQFEQRSIRRTSVSLGLRTEASVRYEKGVPVISSAAASNYASYLIHKHGWGTPLSGMIDEYPNKHVPIVITVKPEKIRNYIAPEITDEIIIESLEKLGFLIEKKGDEISVTVPGHRTDIHIWQDLSEEVARIYGYEKIASSLPDVKTHRAAMMPNLSKNVKLRELLVRCGLTESVSFSFTNTEELKKIWAENTPDAVEIRNPLTEDHTHLRPSIVPSMLKIVAHNNKNIGDKPLRMFELGRIFSKSGSDVSETDSLVIATCGNSLVTPTKSDYQFRQVNYYVLKGIVEQFLEGVTTKRVVFKTGGSEMFHPYRKCEFFVDGTKIGELGEVHPGVSENFEIKDTVSIAVFDLDNVKTLLGEQPVYKSISRFPAMARDLSIIVSDETSAQDIEDIIYKNGTGLLTALTLFDVYKGDVIGEGKKSVSFALDFRHESRTLNDEDLSPIIDNIVKEIGEKLGGSLREK
ncbi:MAG TPA: phenylalanine--tRNA ligase subunit beta [bacterium]|nr:phenylalanine--tRNA ligase subunit beta [bacterium]